VSATEKFLQPDVKADKKVTAAHLLNSEFGFAGSPVAPGDRNYCPRVSAHDRLERKLHGEVKVGSNERTASIDDCFPVSFEGVGRVVQFDVKKELQKFVGKAIYAKLYPRIIDHPASFRKSAAKYAIPPLAQFLPVSNDVATIIGFVSHHDHGSVPLHV